MGLIGAILGDIAGSKYEFKEFRLWGEEEPTTSGRFHTYTDDTVMSIATMEACLTDKDFARCYREYGRKHTKEYGSMMFSWIYDDSAGPYNSWGNGSAMRVSFVAEYLKDRPVEEVENLARKSAEVTHSHPEGIKGAVTTSHCIWMAESGFSKDEILKYAISQYPSSEYKYGSDICNEDYLNNMKWSVSCQDSVPVAIRCFYDTNSFEEFCKRVCRMKCDTDTICAIGGSIAHSYYKKTFDNEREILENALDFELFQKIQNLI